MEPHDVTLVTKTSHPAIFAAFELISHDGGRQAGHQNYVVPLAEFTPAQLDDFDLQLMRLSRDADSDFDCLCTGDEEERNRIVKDYNLADVDRLLQRFFEEFC